MTTNKIENNATLTATCTQRIAALKAHVPSKTEIPINGVLYKPADLIAIYQEILDAQAALIKSRAQVKTDLAARRDAETRRDAIEPSLQSWVLNIHGTDSNEASEFGYAARKKPTRSADEVANAVKLAKATRVARGTMGKKQKEQIRGSLVTPAAPAAPAVHTAPVAVAPAASPAAPAPTTGGVAPTGAATN